MLARTLNLGPLAAALAVTLAVAVPCLAAGGPTVQPRQNPGGAAVRPEAEQAPAQQQGLKRATTAPAMKLEKGTLQKLNSLPKDQMLEVAGKRMTAGEYQVKLREHQKKAAAKVKSWRGGKALNVEAMQADLDKAEAARISAANAKVMSAMSKMAKTGIAPAAPTNGNGEAAAIKSEAAKIQQRMQDGSATPADEQRAKQLIEQYRQLK